MYAISIVRRSRQRGGYVRYHESCGYGAHNQDGNAHGRINHSGANFTPRRQDGIGNFSSCARSFEHTFYNCYEGNRIEVENGIAYRPFERVPRKETRNEKAFTTLYRKFAPTYYLEWEIEVEHLFDAYNVDEDDKATLASCSFSPSILEYILAYRRRKGVGFNTWSELKGALRDKFGVFQFERLELSQAMGNSKGKQEMYISSQGIEKKESMKPSLLGKSSMVDELHKLEMKLTKVLKSMLKQKCLKNILVIP
ncbi:hypothetical protein M9H77_12865 [Catharanthus roseus]|uniref:Uncharacterized protein n=1 Tax=Catharanthus roseus TaxID=4058 RepID=A0ACC0BIN1_CATRO|nr:hypothetical protein M9H77_12865 [Catharanthus roseus]